MGLIRAGDHIDMFQKTGAVRIARSFVAEASGRGTIWSWTGSRCSQSAGKHARPEHQRREVSDAEATRQIAGFIYNVSCQDGVAIKLPCTCPMPHITPPYTHHIHLFFSGVAFIFHLYSWRSQLLRSSILCGAMYDVQNCTNNSTTPPYLHCLICIYYLFSL